jgi:threonine/homoserine/homoserine lactone efflux protein
MIQTFFAGMLLGLILSVTLGPAFFTIIQTSIDRGFKSALLVSTGVILSDIILIFISFYGLTTILDVGHNQIYIAIIGGIILILFGLHTFNKKPEMLIRRSSNFKSPTGRPGILTYVGKGFFLNFLNPFLWIFWLSALSGLIQQTNPDQLQQYLITFFSGTVITVFALDVLKSFIGAKIKKYLKLRTQYRINRIVGLCLMVFGVMLLARIYFF